jgi:hypothetical protein
MGTILLLLIGLIWRWLQQLRTWPVSLSVGAGVIAVFISGGALDLLIFVKLAIQVAACELLYRKLYRPLPSRPLGLGRPRVASRTDR